MKAVLAAALLAGIVGCATPPSSTDSAVHVPADRVVDSSVLRATPGTGQVTVQRDSGAGSDAGYGLACFARISVDGKPVADLRNREKVVMHLPAGNHVFSVRPDGDCLHKWKVVEVGGNVSVGKELRFRAHSSWLNVPSFEFSATAF